MRTEIGAALADTTGRRMHAGDSSHPRQSPGRSDRSPEGSDAPTIDRDQSGQGRAERDSFKPGGPFAGCGTTKAATIAKVAALPDLALADVLPLSEYSFHRWSMRPWESRTPTGLRGGRIPTVAWTTGLGQGRRQQ